MGTVLKTEKVTLIAPSMREVDRLAMELIVNSHEGEPSLRQAAEAVPMDLRMYVIAALAGGKMAFGSNPQDLRWLLRIIERLATA